MKKPEDSDEYCFYSPTGEQLRCSTYNATEKMFSIKGENKTATGILQPNGMIIWSHGFTTNWKGDLCSPKAQGNPTVIIIVVVVIVVALVLILVLCKRKPKQVGELNPNTAGTDTSTKQPINQSKPSDLNDPKTVLHTEGHDDTFKETIAFEPAKNNS